MGRIFHRLGLSLPPDRFRKLASVVGGATLAFLLAVPSPARAQFDFADALAVKIRTYPLKRDGGRLVPGPDGMPLPKAVRRGRPAGLEELPAFPVDENFPGGSILDALQHYQKRDPMGAMGPVLAMLKNGYLEMDIEKPCHIYAVKIQYDHQPTEQIPSFKEAGIASLMQIVADGVVASDLQRARRRLRDRYNWGLSTDRKGDQDAMALFHALRLALALRYNPQVSSPALAGIPPKKAKELFKAEVAKGKPLEGTLDIGPIRLAMKARVDQRKKSPPPAGCPGAKAEKRIFFSGAPEGNGSPRPWGKPILVSFPSRPSPFPADRYPSAPPFIHSPPGIVIALNGDLEGLPTTRRPSYLASLKPTIVNTEGEPVVDSFFDVFTEVDVGTTDTVVRRWQDDQDPGLGSLDIGLIQLALSGRPPRGITPPPAGLPTGIGEVIEIQTFNRIYNLLNQLVGETTVTTQRGKPETATRTDYQYDVDKQGNIIGVISTTTQGGVTQETRTSNRSYDEQNQVVRENTVTTQAGKPETVTQADHEYEYDAKGNVVRLISRTSQGGMTQETQTSNRIYNLRNQLVSETTVTTQAGKPETVTQTNYEYDPQNKNNIIRVISRTSLGGGLQEIRISDRSYNELGHMVGERLTISRAGLGSPVQFSELFDPAVRLQVGVLGRDKTRFDPLAQGRGWDLFWDPHRKQAFSFNASRYGLSRETVEVLMELDFLGISEEEWLVLSPATKRAIMGVGSIFDETTSYIEYFYGPLDGGLTTAAEVTNHIGRRGDKPFQVPGGLYGGITTYGAHSWWSYYPVMEGQNDLVWHNPLHPRFIVGLTSETEIPPPTIDISDEPATTKVDSVLDYLTTPYERFLAEREERLVKIGEKIKKGTATEDERWYYEYWLWHKIADKAVTETTKKGKTGFPDVGVAWGWIVQEKEYFQRLVDFYGKETAEKIRDHIMYGGGIGTTPKEAYEAAIKRGATPEQAKADTGYDPDKAKTSGDLDQGTIDTIRGFIKESRQSVEEKTKAKPKTEEAKTAVEPTMTRVGVTTTGTPSLAGASTVGMETVGFELFDEERLFQPAGSSVTIETFRGRVVNIGPLETDRRDLSWEPDPVFDAAVTPNDPLFASKGSWGQDFADQWALQRIGFKALEDKASAWHLTTGTERPVVVAVIDTGIDLTHPDLHISNIWVNKKEIAGNGRDDDDNGYIDDIIGWNFVQNSNNPFDLVGHGTHVAGLIAARWNNGRGIAGINRGARIMVLKALNEAGKAWGSNIARAIAYAVDNGAQVINISAEHTGHTKFLERAFAYAEKKGVLVVVAAGNKGLDTKKVEPANQPGTLVVAATLPDNTRAKFANWGQEVDVAAPGVDVLSLRATRTDLIRKIAPEPKKIKAEETVVGAERAYYRAGGTSFAAPLVSGLASLIWAKHPKLSNVQVARMIRQSALDIEVPGWDQLTGYGLVDAKGALTADPNWYLVVKIQAIQAVKEQGQPVVQVVGTVEGSRLADYEIQLGKGKEPTDWSTVAKKPGRKIVSGEVVRLKPADFGAPGTWTVRLIARDKDDRTRETRGVVTLR